MQHPIVFTKAPQSVIGPGAAIKYPYGWSELVDYEAGGSLHLHSLQYFECEL
jgi:2-keto-4-pentenoate hydratase/2-oxohepta-3-ene-1,7-dioic acid hydratase in catechol pathway